MNVPSPVLFVLGALAVLALLRLAFPGNRSGSRGRDGGRPQRSDDTYYYDPGNTDPTPDNGRQHDSGGHHHGGGHHGGGAGDFGGHGGGHHDSGFGGGGGGGDFGGGGGHHHG